MADGMLHQGFEDIVAEVEAGGNGALLVEVEVGFF